MQESVNQNHLCSLHLIFTFFPSRWSYHCFPWLSISQLHMDEGPGSFSCFGFFCSLNFTLCYLKIFFPCFSSFLVSLGLQPVHTHRGLKPVMWSFPVFSQSAVNKMAANIHNWEERKIPRNHKDSHWPPKDLKKESNSNGDFHLGKKKPSSNSLWVISQAVLSFIPFSWKYHALS